MKRNIRINISGLIFNIDEDAFEILNQYLERLRRHFGNGESTDEIISDIESRIAELFQEKSGGSENVINIEIVDFAIKAMGEPSEIDGEDENLNEKKTHERVYESINEKVKRKLYRDPDNKVIGGVTSGLSAYFGIDTVWIRLLFVILTLSGMSILVYIILWIVIPEARTTSQKLEMRGEAINLENIEKSIKDEFDDISNRFKNMKDKHFSKKKDELTVFEKIANLFVAIISGILKFIGGFIGVILALVALILILAIIPSFVNNGLFWLNNINGFHFVSLNSVLNLLSNSPSETNMFQVSLALVVFIPLISLVYMGVKIIFGIRNNNNVVGVSLLTLWIVGVVLLVFSTTKIGRSYNKKSDITHNAKLGIIQQDTIFVSFVNSDSLSRILPLVNPVNGEFVLCNDENYFYMTPEVRTISLDSNDELSMKIITQSRGRNYITAQQNVDKIRYNYSFNENNIKLQDYCYWPNNIGYRAQKIKIEIGVPKGKVIIFNPQKDSNLNEEELNFYFDKNNGYRFIYVDDNSDRVIISDGKNFIDIDD